MKANEGNDIKYLESMMSEDEKKKRKENEQSLSNEDCKEKIEYFTE